MFYFLAILAGTFLVVILASAWNQKKLHSHEDLFGVVELMLPVNTDRMQGLFDPAEEWNLRSRNTPEAFKTIQGNRRRLAIQYASHMYRNARLLQRLGRAALRKAREPEALTGRMLLNAGVAVRMRSCLLLIFLRLQQVLYTGSNLSATRDVVNDLLPEYKEMLRVASSLSRSIDPKLHDSLIGVL